MLARKLNHELRQYACRVQIPCGLTVVYKIPLPLTLASRDSSVLSGIDNKPTKLNKQNCLLLWHYARFVNGL